MAEKEVEIGEMRHRLTLLSSASAGQSKSGQQLYSYTLSGPFWAKVEPLTGRELVNAKQVKATISHKITMRQVAAIKPTDRFQFQATPRLFNIETVIRIGEQNAFYLIHATELFGEKP
jgi:SPP1 family predicted phage head-tail adaptor